METKNLLDLNDKLFNCHCELWINIFIRFKYILETKDVVYGESRFLGFVSIAIF